MPQSGSIKVHGVSKVQQTVGRNSVACLSDVCAPVSHPSCCGKTAVTWVISDGRWEGVFQGWALFRSVMHEAACLRPLNLKRKRASSRDKALTDTENCKTRRKYQPPYGGFRVWVMSHQTAKPCNLESLKPIPPPVKFHMISIQ